MFIVIDGIDGSGKTTQFELLKKRLAAAGRQVAVIKFPRYGQKSAGLVEDYLNGKFGSAAEVGPYRASIFYAVDRYAASEELRRYLKEEKIILADRYLSANLCHQGGKIADPQKRREFFAWDENLEYNILGIPRPNLTFILYLKPELAKELADRREEQTMVTEKKRDIHEADFNHLRAAADCYLELSQSSAAYQLINCAPNEQLLSPEEIHEKIWQIIESKLRTK